MAQYINQRLPRFLELEATRRETEPGLQINRKANGRETRNQRFSQSLLQYEIGYPPQEYEAAAVAAVKEMFRVSRGGEFPFRFRDFDPTMSKWDMELIGEGNGTIKTFQCKKTWTIGSMSSVRTITKPVDPIQVYLEDVLQTGTYVVDYNTGIILFGTAPANGDSVKISGNFDILVRFDKSYEAVGLTHWLEHTGTLLLEEVNDLGETYA